MSLTINLAQQGVVGVIGLTAGELSSLNNNQVMDVNVVYALTGSEPFTISLPSPNDSDVWEGSVIILKNLTDDGTRIDIGRQDNVFIDGIDPDEEPFTSVFGEVLSFYYINERIGWLAGPAVTT